MQLVDIGDDEPWKQLRANNQFVCSRSGKHKQRFQQHAELVDERRGEDCHHAWDIHVHIDKRFNYREPNGDDSLHPDSNQCCWLSHIYANRYRRRGKRTNDRRFHGQCHNYRFRFQQHAELGNEGSD
jgi:hypothetical protein